MMNTNDAGGHAFLLTEDSKIEANVTILIHAIDLGRSELISFNIRWVMVLVEP